MALVCKYVALFVPDLRAAEEFYGRAFGMHLLFRESEQEGEWRTLRPTASWEDAKAAGARLHMVALERDDFVLALFHGSPTSGTVLEICLGVDGDEIDAVHERLSDIATVVEARENYLRFEDPFGFRWALQEPDTPFRSSGEIAGRWLEV